MVDQLLRVCTKITNQSCVCPSIDISKLSFTENLIKPQKVGFNFTHVVYSRTNHSMVHCYAAKQLTDFYIHNNNNKRVISARHCEGLP